jgi:hypothetical protein
MEMVEGFDLSKRRRCEQHVMTEVGDDDSMGVGEVAGEEEATWMDIYVMGR